MPQYHKKKNSQVNVSTQEIWMTGYEQKFDIINTSNFMLVIKLSCSTWPPILVQVHTTVSFKYSIDY